jgi:large subunit ribosomal protein L25
MSVEATQIPERVVVDVQGLPAGTQVLAREVPLPEGAELVTDPEALVVNVTAQITAEALESELAEAEAAAGIEHEEPEAEEAPAEAGADESQEG